MDLKLAKTGSVCTMEPIIVPDRLHQWCMGLIKVYVVYGANRGVWDAESAIHPSTTKVYLVFQGIHCVQLR